MIVAAGLLGASVLALAYALAGVAGWLYLTVFVMVAAAGLPIGFLLFGRHHAGGWIAGAVFGYGLSAFSWWLAVQAGLATIPAFPLVWGVLLIGSIALGRSVQAPLVSLPVWTRRDSTALLLTLLLVPALVGPPFSRIGERDPLGQRRYRAYFTADFLWHVALTAELSKRASPPRNPYLARRPLHYYWTYFTVPAVLVAAGGVAQSIEQHLMLNALCAGLLFIASIYLAAWTAVPRAGPVAIAVILACAAASAEGLYAALDLYQRGRPLAELRDLNIDAITSWYFRSLTIDGLPRSLWYTPQHAFACGAGLLALTVATGRKQRPAIAAALAGVALAMALVFSPFLGGVFALVYGAAAALRALANGRFIPDVALAALAVVPVGLALAWCVLSGTFEGAGGAIAIGLSSRAAAAPFTTLALALGPILVPCVLGLVVGWKAGWNWQGALVALLTGIVMLFFVTLTTEPIWIGWRAGQVLLVTMPALAAAGFAWLFERSRATAVVLIALLLVVGLPTTIIDARNASDVGHTAMGPGFRWTVVVPRDTEAATDWIRANTPPDAIVQMSIEPRGRETWTLIPSFAERRMAAGQPISLLSMPEYDERSAQADAMYRTTDPAEAFQLARTLRLDFVFVDSVERQAFPQAAIAKFDDERYFGRVFSSGAAAVYAVK